MIGHDADPVVKPRGDTRGVLRLPEEFRKSLRSHTARRSTKHILRKNRINTVCEEARCANIGECFSNKTATFMIMGDRCTRRCHFCSVTTKKPLALDPTEAERVASAAIDMDLKHVVITSVDRDDLPDGGCAHFGRVVNEVKRCIPSAIVEVLTPDFKGSLDLIDNILASGLDIFGHNIESVPRLYKSLRPQSEFATSLAVITHAGKNKKAICKSGLMVGVGESDDEVLETMSLLKDAGVKIVTIGQYLRPTLKHWPVHRYVGQESYDKYVAHGEKIGLAHVFAGPFVRSSYHAGETFLVFKKPPIVVPRLDRGIHSMAT